MTERENDFVREAFLQLSFAIKMWHFLREHPIDKEKFDTDITVENNSSRVCLSQNEFESYDQIIIASENNMSICFGIAANTLWEAMKKKKDITPAKLNPEIDKANNIISLTYMIRCCFAHGPAQPVWHIEKDKYRTQYKVGNVEIDLRNIVNGTSFDYATIGGYDTLWLLKNVALEEGLIRF